MEWYVLLHDFNKGKVVTYNIFNNARLKEYLDYLEKNFISKETLIPALERSLRWCFWSQAEYEMMVGDLFEKDLNKYEKIDVYDQLRPNLNNIADYIIKYWKKDNRL